jgi:hypothetical protein
MHLNAGNCVVVYCNAGGSTLSVLFYAVFCRCNAVLCFAAINSRLGILLTSPRVLPSLLAPPSAYPPATPFFTVLAPSYVNTVAPAADSVEEEGRFTRACAEDRDLKEQAEEAETAKHWMAKTIRVNLEVPKINFFMALARDLSGKG